jgi:hypothetical protein
MSQLFTPGLQISPATKVIKRRELPLQGRVLVSVGDVVTSSTIVAEADREGELRIVRVGDELGVLSDEVPSYMKLAIGESVAEGQCIAEAKGLWGLFKTRVASPISGAVEFISTATGHVGIRAAKKTIELSAYIDGVVSSVVQARGVIIEETGTFVQGIFGVGGERVGKILPLAGSCDSPVTEGDVPNDVRGAILVGGHSPSLAALQKAQSLGAVGFITGSIDDTTLCGFVGYDIGVALTGDEPVSMTLIITEGFGRIPINARIIEILKGIAGSTASINGATQVRAGALRPEIISRVSDSSGSHNHVLGTGLVVGSRVRLIRVPYFGMHGIVTELPHELVSIETGAFARVARVALADGGHEVLVPRANLEMA